MLRNVRFREAGCSGSEMAASPIGWKVSGLHKKGQTNLSPGKHKFTVNVVTFDRNHPLRQSGLKDWVGTRPRKRKQIKRGINKKDRSTKQKLNKTETSRTRYDEIVTDQRTQTYKMHQSGK